VYLQLGKFAPEKMGDFVRRLQGQALADGFSGLRILGEMSWVLGSEPTANQLLEYEALLNEFLSSSRTMAACLYDRGCFTPDLIHDVLRCHPLAVLGAQVHPNPYHEPAELVLDPHSAGGAELKARRVEWWLAQLLRAMAAAQEREQAAAAVRSSEERFQLVARATNDVTWDWNLETNAVWWSDNFYTLFGYQREQIEQGIEAWYTRLHPGDRERVIAGVHAAINSASNYWASEYRFRRGDGSYASILDRGYILRQEGSPLRLLGAMQDVTAYKKAQEELRIVSRRLLEVQESERRRLARELHDEIGQLLTGLRFLLKPDVPAAPGEVQTRFQQARELVDELLNRVRNLSGNLRPAALDQFGLVPALLTLFERFTEQTGVRVHFKHNGGEQRFAPEVEIAAYRIVQEALTNVARHAGVHEATVRVWVAADMLSVQIEDFGRGFEAETVQQARRGNGLGGMHERVMLLDGHLSIESKPGFGTQITAQFPMREAVAEPDHDPQHCSGGRSPAGSAGDAEPS
jgi:PAS domain S-box-containing protein